MRSRKLLIVAAIAVASLAGCRDFFGTIDLKESIRSEVVEASAAEVSISVRPDPAVPGGTTSSSGATQKVGIPFEVTVTTFGDYAFTGWSQAGGTGTVVFASASSPTTNATITEAGEGIVIQANFTRRPEIETTDPFNYATDVLKNKRIQIFFSKPMDPATVNFQTISITHKPYGSGGAPVSITDRYEDPAPDPGNLLFRINLKSGLTLEENHLVSLRVAKSATDAQGNEMAEEDGISFLVGTEEDMNPPVWEVVNPITLLRFDGSPLGTGNATNTPSLQLRPRAYDSEDLIQFLNVEETGGATVLSNLLYQTSIPYTLQTPGTGSKTFELTLQDPSGNESAPPRVVTLIYDTDPPGTPSFTSPPTSPTNAAVAFAVTAVDIGLAGIKQYEVTGGATTTPTSVGGSFSGVVPAAQGDNVISVVAVDHAGNTSGEGTYTVFYDSVAPDQPSVSTMPTSPTNLPVSFAVQSTDPAPSSGIVEYRVTSGATSTPTSATGSFSNVTPASQGVSTITVVAVDTAGNTSASRSIPVTYDSQPPAVSNYGVGQTARTDAYTTSNNVTVWADVTDLSTPVQAAFSTSSGGPWSFGPFTSGITTYTLPDVLDTYTVYARFRDTLGNTTSSTISDTIVYDDEAPPAPTVVTPPADPAGSAVSFTVESVDNGPAGTAYYRVTSGAVGAPFNDGDGIFTGVTPAVQGTNTIFVRAVDNAGNDGPTVGISFVYDTQDPDQPGLVVGPTSPTNDPVDFTVSATDNGAAGIASYEVTSGAVGAPFSQAGGAFSGVVPAAQGANTISVRAVDNAGNVGPTLGIDVTYDSQPPSVSNYGVGVTSRTDTTTTTDVVTVWADVIDSHPPVEIAMSTDPAFVPGGGDWQGFTSGTTTFTLPSSGTHTVYAFFRDALGNPTPAAQTDTITYTP